MQLKLAVAYQNLTDMGELVEVVIDTLDGDHRLTVAINGQRQIGHALSGHLDLRQLTNLGEHRVVGRCRLALYGCQLYLRVESGEERGHKVAEPIEHAERHHQSHCGHSHAPHRDTTDEVDDVGRFLRKEITTGDVEREAHCFSSSSIRSI